MLSLSSTIILLLIAITVGLWQRKTVQSHPRILGDVLLVFAHPDDEAMFFSPLLAYLKRSKVTVHLLCLSNGNFSGLGTVREKELQLSAQFFGVHRNHVRVLDLPGLQDGMNTVWDVDLIRQEVCSYMRKAKNVRTVITFDKNGVSYHPNHIAVYNGTRSTKENMPPGIIFLTLRTRGIFGKYAGFLALLTYLFVYSIPDGPRKFAIVVPPSSVLASFLAMRKHRSQLVWFRYLFLFFSSYTYVNEVEEMTTA